MIDESFVNISWTYLTVQWAFSHPVLDRYIVCIRVNMILHEPLTGYSCGENNIKLLKCTTLSLGNIPGEM